MHPFKPKYEFPIPGAARTQGAGRPAGIYLLDGRCHVAAFSSSAERELVERGALRIADLRFDQPRDNTAPSSATVRLITIGSAVIPLPDTGRN